MSVKVINEKIYNKKIIMKERKRCNNNKYKQITMKLLQNNVLYEKLK